ncbi:anti-sigma factor [Celeribacter naphthalenivorans]|uniref:anti-sigma factor n=1 Tax=Celeribacter naphthalenivorans TaxID=1614694 RepID=UPI001CFA0A2B|nr:anti-sigma factor [Celeribacter naphthalenivorans]
MTDESDHMDHTESNDPALAGEYVLRLLDAVEEARFKARLKDDPELQRMVHEWERELAVFAGDLAEVRPSKALKSRIMAQIAPAPTGPKRSIFGLWVSGAAAVAMIGFLAFAPVLNAPGPKFHVDLVSGDLVVAAGFIPETDVMIVQLNQGAPRPGRVLELWLIADGSETPVSLGLVPSEIGEIRVTIPPALLAQVEGATMAVSDEPPGGSPTGQPTGDILASAAVFEL